MPDVIRTIRTWYHVETGSALAAVKTLAEQMNAGASASVSMQRGMSGLGGTVTSTIGGFQGLAFTLESTWSLASRITGVFTGTIGTLLRMGSAAQDSTIAIAGMMSAGGAPGAASDFNKAMGMAESVIAKMRKHASLLPGEFEDLQRVFQGGLSGGLGAGKSINQIEALSAKMMAVSSTLSVDSAQAGRDFALMMEGRAGSHVAMFTKLRNLIGMTAEDFNKLSQKERFEILDTKALTKWDAAIKEMGTSWTAISSTTADYYKEILRIGGAPFFQTATGILSEINDWYTTHRASIFNMASALGGQLADAMKKGWGYAKDVLTWISTHKEELLGIAKAYAALYVGSSLLGGGGGKRKTGGAEDVLGGATDSPLGGPLTQVTLDPFGIGAKMEKVSAFNAAWGQMIARGAIVGAAAGFQSHMMSLGAGMGVLEHAVTAANGVIGGMTGAMSALPGTLGLVGTALTLFHQGLMQLADYIDKRQKREIETETEASTLTKTVAGSEINNALISRAAEAYSANRNTDMRRQFEAVVIPLLTRARTEGAFVADGKFNYAAYRQTLIGKGIDIERAELAASRAEYAFFQARKLDKPLLDRLFGTKEDESLSQTNPNAPGLIPKGRTNVNITQNIHNTFNEADNPERVLVKLAGVVEQATRRPIETAGQLGGVIR